MKWSQQFIFAIGLTAFLAALVGCENEITQEDIDNQKAKVEQAQQELDALQKRQEVEDDMQANMDEIRKKIDQLKEHASEASGEREVELRGEIAMLETKYDQAKAQLNELRAASGDTWAKLKIKTQEAWQDVSSSIEKKVEEWKQNQDSDDSESSNDETQKKQ